MHITDLEAIRDAIANFFNNFQDKMVVGIILPTGWYGRAWDNYYELKSADIDATESRIDLDLGWNWKIRFVPESSSYFFALDATMMGLRVGVSSGETGSIPGSGESFGGGDVKFCISTGPDSSEDIAAGVWKTNFKYLINELANVAVSAHH